MKKLYFVTAKNLIATPVEFVLNNIRRFVDRCNFLFNHLLYLQYKSKIVHMKKISSLAAIVGLISLGFVSCKKEISSGLPDNLINTPPDSVLIAKEIGLFSEGSSVLNKYPVLFDTVHEKKIILKNDAYVYVTFLHEGAFWTNSLGYYTYPASGSPSNANKTILFPNISETGEGGALKPGDMVQVGNSIIPKGTVIGFYLVAQGWDSKKGRTVDGIYTNYTDKIFNTHNFQQSIIFIEKTTGKLVLGFEDTLLDSPDSDADYNDIVVSISDSKDPAAKPTSFDLTSIPVL